MQCIRYISILSVIIGLSLVTSSCRHRVDYGDPTSVDPLSTDFGSSDLQAVATSMVGSLLSSPSLPELTLGRRPVILVSRVKNKTMQHIDTESITDSIRTRLIRSGEFRFIDRTTDEAAVDELMIQQEGGLVDPGKAVAFGQQHGAEYLLVTNISSIQQKSGSVKDVYYKVTMSLKSLKSGILEWSDETEIRKVRKKTLLGK